MQAWHWALAGVWGVWVAWGVQAWVCVLLNGKLLRRVRRPVREKFERFTPRAVVIVPFKGLEPGLAEHVRAMLNQDYPAYEVLLVVESREDAAYEVLTREAEAVGGMEGWKGVERGVRARVMVAGLAGPNEGQKVHNQLAALGVAMSRVQEGDVPKALVFADSDAAAGPDWLAHLVGPLVESQRTAVTSGYRWLIPTDDALPSRLASVLNSSVAAFAGRDRLMLAWGGSMAMLTTTAAEGDLIGHLRGSLSDDYQVTRMARALGRRVYFVPQCLVTSPASFTWTSLVEFARRQHLITRLHMPAMYWAGLAMLTLYIAGLASAWGILLASLLWEPPRPLLPRSIATLLTVAAANLIRSSLRRRIIRARFGEATLARLTPTLRLDRWATSFWITLHWLLMLRAMVGRTITWRGVRYRIDGPQRIVREGEEMSL